MPTVLRENGYRFFFYSDEGDPREPCHVHVRLGGAEAKFWLTPEVKVARSEGFSAVDLREITRIVERHHVLLREAWHGYFG